MRFFYLIILCNLIMPSYGFAQSISEEFASQLNGVQTMQAGFKQIIYDNHGKAVQQSYGEMAFSRPGKFRWQVKKPIPQLIIANGNKLWIYDPDLRQVIIRSLQKAVGETPALLLSHVSTSIENDFKVQKNQSQNTTEQWFTLLPKRKDSMFAHIQMGFSGKQIREMRLEDQLGHTTKIIFTQAKINTRVSNNKFVFKSPPHVDIIDETKKKP